MLKNLLLKTLIMQFPLLAFSQGDPDLTVMNDFKKSLQSESNIKEIKVIHTKFDNGNTRELCLGVKYLSDTTDSWWQVGPLYMYHKNGQPRIISYTDAVLVSETTVNLDTD